MHGMLLYISRKIGIGFHVSVNLASHAILIGAVLSNLCVLDVYNQQKFCPSFYERNNVLKNIGLVSLVPSGF